MNEPIIQNRLNTESLWILNHKIIESNKIKVIVLGDSHLNTKGWNSSLNRYDLDINGKRYVKILKHIIKNHEDTLFIIHGGDTIGEGLIVKDEIEKEDNMKAFINVTKSILNEQQIPIFTSIGDSDYIVKNKEYEPRLFLQYIGDEVNKIDIQDTSISFININPLFNPNSIHFLQNTLTNSKNQWYLVDFHIPLKLNKLTTLYNNNPNKEKENLLSLKETKKLLTIFNQNVIGIFNHHLHLSQQLKIREIPYLISSCAGNKTSSHYANYFVLEIDDIYNHPKITKINTAQVI